MKNVKNIPLLLFISVFLAACSVENENANEIQERDEKQEELNLESREFMEETWPKEIPRSSEWIKQAASREDLSWKEVDDYYQNELKSREEKGEENPDLINNLKAMTLSTLIQRTDFLKQASMERLIFYIVDLSADADNESGNIGDYAQLVRSCKERGLDEYQEFKVRKFVTKGFRRYIAIHETRENVNYDYEEKYAEDIAFLKTMRRR